MKRLAIVTSHPIQYNAPWFRLLNQSKDITVKVFYTWSQSQQGKQFDPGFGQHIQWDIPLLDGYEYVFVENIATDPGTHHYKGIITPGLQKEIQEWKPDALLVFGWSFHSHLNCLRHFHGKIPVLFRGDSTLLDERRGVKRIMRRIFLRWVYRHIDFALYTGINNKAYFLAHGLKEKQLVFSPHAIDNARFTDAEGAYIRRAKSWRIELGFREEDVVVLFVGKLEPQKNPTIILDVARKLTDSRIKFLLVGNGEVEQELKTKAAGLNNIRFLDFQNQSVMPIVYRLGNIFILPSVSETWGLALNEAMACGLPVIASDKVGGAIDLIKPDQNGYIFPHGDVEKLHESLLNSIANLSAMGRQSEAMIQSWSFSAIKKSIHSTLNNK